MKLTIKRSQWLRGKRSWTGDLNQSALRTGKNGLPQMCCLGFYALACGFSEDQIHGEPTPSDLHSSFDSDVDVVLSSDQKKYFQQLLDNEGIGYNSEITTQLMDINDSLGISEDTRERRITRLFQKIGVEVTFVD